MLYLLRFSAWQKTRGKRPFFDFCVLSSFLQCSMAILTEKKRLVVIQCGHKDLLGIFPDCYYYYKSIIVNLGFYNQVHRLLSDLGCKIHLSTIKHAENLLLCYLLTKKRFVHVVQYHWLSCVTFARLAINHSLITTAIQLIILIWISLYFINLLI